MNKGSKKNDQSGNFLLPPNQSPEQSIDTELGKQSKHDRSLSLNESRIDLNESGISAADASVNETALSLSPAKRSSSMAKMGGNFIKSGLSGGLNTMKGGLNTLGKVTNIKNQVGKLADKAQAKVGKVTGKMVGTVKGVKTFSPKAAKILGHDLQIDSQPKEDTSDAILKNLKSRMGKNMKDQEEEMNRIEEAQMK